MKTKVKKEFWRRFRIVSITATIILAILLAYVLSFVILDEKGVDFLNYKRELYLITGFACGICVGIWNFAADILQKKKNSIALFLLIVILSASAFYIFGILADIFSGECVCINC